MAGGTLWLDSALHQAAFTLLSGSGEDRIVGQCGLMGSRSHGQKMNSCKLLKTLGTGDEDSPGELSVKYEPEAV